MTFSLKTPKTRMHAHFTKRKPDLSLMAYLDLVHMSIMI